MKHIWLIYLGIALLVLSAFPTQAYSGEGPSFLQTGKAYNMVISGTLCENITVLEIDHGWIRIKQAGREYWLNTNFIEKIFPVIRKPTNP